MKWVFLAEIIAPMFFIFSKLLLIFILPLTWILACLIAGLIIKKPKLKRRLILASAILLLIFTNPFLFDQFVSVWDIQPVPLKSTGQYSCAIVLGGFAGEDANGHGQFNSASDRFIQGLKLITTGKASHILISGGNGSLAPGTFRESDWVKNQLLLMNVPDSSIITENRSRNTIENAAFSKILLNKQHLQQPYILVTSAFHMRRSLGIFKRAGIAVVPYPCNYLKGNGGFSIGEFIPDAAMLNNWNIYTKEIVGTIVNYIR
jgi:uncharacterized SAM-binding protein YcdF (DUF218 family)